VSKVFDPTSFVFSTIFFPISLISQKTFVAFIPALSQFLCVSSLTFFNPSWRFSPVVCIFSRVFFPISSA